MNIRGAERHTRETAAHITAATETWVTPGTRVPKLLHILKKPLVSTSNHECHDQGIPTGHGMTARSWELRGPSQLEAGKCYPCFQEG